MSECERCGRERAPGPNRHRVTFHDETDATVNHDVVQLCPQCYNTLQSRIREMGR